LENKREKYFHIGCKRLEEKEEEDDFVLQRSRKKCLGDLLSEKE